MIIPYDLEVSLNEYSQKGKANDFPVFDQCPNCQCTSSGNLYRNGFYWRNAVTQEVELRIPICRMKCLLCKANISILPDFLNPYFQYSLHTILKSVEQALEKKKGNGYRQLWRYHLRRFIRNINWIHNFYIDNEGDINEKGKKEAINYMKRILDFGESSFLRRSWGHLSTYFMAH
ncbi:DUF6431 domain-containing protein [Aquibacillus rhizosphaerae]|uniref:DUF6431 domain-containing protein n=1 Tax=Aquibacillus rhizosphaerae TaxID=3051431 RepID=A0ABT7LDG1_9BACI|nr:DUF6431 domain-containing protein [Aquibacillus sp. LR5S19]MDL4842635.1 DUF6431 domain-containing protein [Aquibacillus sp. LR5S19]